MGANTSNALYFLISTLLNLYLSAVLLRIVLSAVRADFYNPISQLVWKITQPVLAPLRNAVPRWKRLDTAAALLLLLVSTIYIHVTMWMFDMSLATLAGVFYAVLKVLVLAGNVYTVTLTFQAILSWFGPGVNNPASNILWSMNEPVLRPIRRLIPSISGLDLSPLFAIIAIQVLVRLVPLPNLFRAGILG
ncbi:YggT family protein [Panacagrimonas sp.]|uniref:YggT family protein n=1 Tax=Panacagrimonas sp. TaxID=2480088 RepID=UPI003B52620A